MQSPEMCAFRPLHLCKTLKNISHQNPNLSVISCEFRQPRKSFRPIPNRRFTTSTPAEDDTSASSWSIFRRPPPPSESSFPSPPPPLPSDSSFPSPPPSSDSSSPSHPPHGDSSSPSHPPPSEWSFRRDSEVKTFYDPTAGGIVTRRGRVGDENPDPGANAAEPPPPSVEVGRKVYGEVSGSSSYTSTLRKRGKSKAVYVCESCGNEHGQWWGMCQSCREVGTLKRISFGSMEKNVSGINVSENMIRSWLPNEIAANRPIKLSDVCDRMDELNWRIPLPGPFGDEVQRVLGGGLVPGSLVLLGGEPGVGKSTLLLQVAGLLSEVVPTGFESGVLYVSGEESIEQIANRADRLQIVSEELFLYSSTDIEEILEQAQKLSPRAIVIDSVQTVYLKGVTGVVGGLSQVKECASALLRFAKKSNIPIFLVGHVTKSGDIAGPQVLEHIVDVVLFMEGEKSSSHRLLRVIKNRFGSTDELGVFEMVKSGLQGVSNPSEMFLGEQHSAESHFLAGLAVAVVMDGSRAFLIEIQALCVVGTSLVIKLVNCVPSSRAQMLISVITKQTGLKLQENGIFLNVVSGYHLTETAGDLAIAAAICSSFLEFPIPRGVAFIAEVGLGGELRMVPQLEKRVNTLAKLGYKKCIISESAVKFLSELQPQGMEILGCRNLKEMITTVFKN